MGHRSMDGDHRVIYPMTEKYSTLLDHEQPNSSQHHSIKQKMLRRSGSHRHAWKMYKTPMSSVASAMNCFLIQNTNDLMGSVCIFGTFPAQMLGEVKCGKGGIHSTS